jgi:hypothetical protein
LLYERQVHLLEEALAPYLSPGFFFVDIGANDGMVADPICPFIRPYGARGIFVEPVPYVFERLQANYADVPGIVFENVAVAPTPRSFHYIERGSGGLEYVINQIGSLDRDRVLDAINNLRVIADLCPPTPPLPPGHPGGEPHQGTRIPDDLESFVRELDVECVTFDELLTRNSVEHVDFLNLDTEGLDYEICCSIDFDRHRPTVMVIETAEFPDGGLEFFEAEILPRGYRFLRRFGQHSRVYVYDA